jgi:hypothetical protein
LWVLDGSILEMISEVARGEHPKVKGPFTKRNILGTTACRVHA